MSQVAIPRVIEALQAYAAAHPGFTAVQGVLTVLSLCPAFLTAPFFGLLGFSSIGPVAGTA